MVGRLNMGLKFSFTLVVLVHFLGTLSTFAQTTYYARVNGNWGTAATWSTVSCSGAAATTLPGANDHVIICAGRTIDYTAGTTTVASLTVELTAVLSHTGGNNANLIARSLVLKQEDYFTLCIRRAFSAGYCYAETNGL